VEIPGKVQIDPFFHRQIHLTGQGIGNPPDPVMVVGQLGADKVNRIGEAVDEVRHRYVEFAVMCHGYLLLLYAAGLRRDAEQHQESI
jgi:hypothetical protein